jgi:hypothetical protein
MNTPGDRKSDCKARMEPIALAFKNYEVNPFTRRGSGEVMIVHQCVSCDKVSPNRIAGDDNEYQILTLLEETLKLDSTLLNRIKNLAINIVTPNNREDILISLFGINYKKYIQKET